MDFSRIKQWFFDAMKAVEEYLIPLAQVALTFIPGVSPVIVTAVDGLPSMMKVMENILPENGQGPLRSKAILSAFKSICDEVDKSLPAGSQSSFAQLEPILIKLMSVGIQMVNTKDPTIVDKPVG